MTSIARSNFRKSFLIALAVAMVSVSGCGGDSGSSADSDDANVGANSPGDDEGSSAEMVRGVGQKGPFAPDATARVTAFDADGPALKESVTVPIDDNGGYSFTFESLPQMGSSDGYELRLEGRFFDEITGNFSTDTRSLRALFKDRSPGNVNLYTHILAPRIMTLMAPAATADSAEELDFEAARNQAVRELQGIFDMDNSPGELNLLKDQEHSADSANLLLFSVASLAAGGGQDALEAIANDFGDDGLLNGNGVAPLGAIAQAAANDPDLLGQARLRLQNQYGMVPPREAGGDLPDWVPEYAGSNDDSGPGVVTDPDDGDSASDGGDNGDGSNGGGSKPDANNPDGIADQTITGTVSEEVFTRGGVINMDYQPGDNVVLQSISPREPGAWNLAFFRGLAGSKSCGRSENDESGSLISLTLPQDDGGTKIFSSSNTPLGECSVTVTRNDGPGGTYAGAFAGSLYAEDGSSVQVTDGAFTTRLPEEEDQ